MLTRLFRLLRAGIWLLAALPLGWGWLPAAEAHPLNNGYSQISIEGKTVQYELTIPEPSLLAYDTNKDNKLEPAELDAQRAALEAYIRAHLELETPSGPLPLALNSIETTEKTGIPAVSFRLSFAGQSAVTGLTIRYSLLFDDADPLHLNFAVITRGNDMDQTVFDTMNRIYHYEPMVRTNMLGSAWTFFVQGLKHILGGYDHLLFLLSLVLVAQKLKEIVKIVTAFTIAHSITLFLAATGHIAADSRWIESGIALTIAYVAVENMTARSFRLRWPVTFLFGLIHGMGFAGAIGEIGLPEQYMISSLLSFNIGVETGQLALVALALPLLLRLQRSPRYRTGVVGASALVLLVALYWFLQRIGLLP
ncbi:HupE/UreJ family protein [Paenibacillus hamazuiensis]|uniref:HupE/UreJ family protein n=1 Tax=Paenibacillus hamazuiensis TaxID=2936508 RepID=UPI00200F5BA1|nr:HupE/UreJ family protein [Paenibacillus hamazuiensis]